MVRGSEGNGPPQGVPPPAQDHTPRRAAVQIRRMFMKPFKKCGLMEQVSNLVFTPRLIYVQERTKLTQILPTNKPQLKLAKGATALTYPEKLTNCTH